MCGFGGYYPRSKCTPERRATCPKTGGLLLLTEAGGTYDDDMVVSCSVREEPQDRAAVRPPDLRLNASKTESGLLL